VTEKKKYEMEIEYLSYHDQLTGVKNRRYFDEALITYDEPCYYPLALIVVDINGLKLTNDAFGHLVGDRLLIEATMTLKREIRGKDTVARIGGDEFVIIMPNTSRDEAILLSERLSQLFHDKAIEGLPISASFGEAVKVDDSLSISEVFNLAEDRMYHHKGGPFTARCRIVTTTGASDELHERRSERARYGRNASRYRQGRNQQ